jgi:hypothetical protein
MAQVNAVRPESDDDRHPCRTRKGLLYRTLLGNNLTLDKGREFPTKKAQGALGKFGLIDRRMVFRENKKVGGNNGSC